MIWTDSEMNFEIRRILAVLGVSGSLWLSGRTQLAYRHEGLASSWHIYQDGFYHGLVIAYSVA